MDALTILQQAAEKTGWNTESMLSVLCEYVDNQQDTQALVDFVQQQVENEYSA